MHDEVIEREEVEDGFTVEIVYDEMGGEYANPREWDNLGVMACDYRGYSLGDEEANLGQYEGTLNDYLRELVEERGATVILPLFVYEHSGITMSAGSNVAESVTAADVAARGRFIGDDAGWDTSTVGFIFDTTETREACGTPPERIEDALRGEVATYAQYLEGDIVGWVVRDISGDVVESAWGHFPDDSKGWEHRYDYILEEARDAAKFVAQEQREEAYRRQMEQEAIWSRANLASFQR